MISIHNLSPKERAEKIYKDCIDLIPTSVLGEVSKSDVHEIATRCFHYIVSNTIVASPSNWIKNGFNWEEPFLISPEKCWVDAELFWEKVQEDIPKDITDYI